MGIQEARMIVDWMVMGQEDGGGGRRAEWVPASSAAGGSEKTIAWIWWRRPEEWAKLIADWVCYLRRSEGLWLTRVLGRGNGSEEYRIDSL